MWDQAEPGKITEADAVAIRRLWRRRCQFWWEQSDRTEAICDVCSVKGIARSQGYHRGSDVVCEPCALKATNAEVLAELQRNPDYWGVSELRRARNLAAGVWQFEPPRLTVL